MRREETLAAYAFLVPNVLVFVVFLLIPIVFSVVISLHDWDLLQEPVWVGLSNYRELLGRTTRHDTAEQATGIVSQLAFWRRFEANDLRFWRYLGNTFYFMLGIPINIALSLCVALLVNQKLRGIVIFRTIFFLPVMASLVACALLWQWIYNSDYGILNVTLSRFHLPTPQWLSNPHWVKPAIILMGIWKNFGYNMLLYLAGLQGIPQDYYDAASVDGAGSIRKFWHITLPSLSPTTFFILIISVISGFRVFGAVYVMTKGGPSGASTPLVYYIYSNGFQWFRMGYASAVAWVLFALTLSFTFVQWRYGGRRVHYA